MKKSTAVVILGTLGGSAFLVGCRSSINDGQSQYDNAANNASNGRSGGRGGGYVGGYRSGYRSGGSSSVSSPRGGFGSIGRSIGGFFSGG